MFGGIIAALPQADPGVVDLKSGCGALHLAARIGDCEVQSSGDGKGKSPAEKKKTGMP